MYFTDLNLKTYCCEFTLNGKGWLIDIWITRWFRVPEFCFTISQFSTRNLRWWIEYMGVRMDLLGCVMLINCLLLSSTYENLVSNFSFILPKSVTTDTTVVFLSLWLCGLLYKSKKRFPTYSSEILYFYKDYFNKVLFPFLTVTLSFSFYRTLP